MPRFCIATAIASGSAEPPITTFQREKSVRLAWGWLMIMCRMVGTQCEKVTPSSAMSRQIRSGW